MVRRAGAGTVSLALMVGLLAGTGSPAAGEPLPPPTPAADSTGTTNSTGSTVLIVHAAGDSAEVADTAAGAQTSSIEVRHTFPAAHTFSVQVPKSAEAAAVAHLEATPGVTQVEPPVTRTVSAIPNDPGFGRELAYLNAVRAPEAWDVARGSAGIRIAVIDTGIDVNHPDLRGKVVGTFNADNGGSTITDRVGHGTFVAGVAAATTDNDIGVAGAGYDTSLLGVKITGPDDELSIDDEIAGINWAVAHHADIINLSFGGSEPSVAERVSIENAIAKGVLVVAAAGNEADTSTQYPAGYPGVISVGATNPATHRRAGFSSYGSWVSLAAPGVGVYSTTPTKGSEFFATRSGYATGDGTSFAAPLVAGEAALLKATNPSLTVTQLRRALVASAHGYAGQGLGTGQVDFARALLHLPPTAGPTAASVLGSSDRVRLRASSASPDVRFRVDSGAWSALVPVTDESADLGYDTYGLANGEHTLSVQACSAYAECGSASSTASFRLANTAPTLLVPSPDATATGLFAVRAQHDSGGGARLLIDGRTAGFAAHSPYSFTVNASALRNGAHTLKVALCSSSGTLCAGPASPPRTIRIAALHPVITSFSHPTISPNADRVGDTGVLHFTLPDTESVLVRTIDRSGRVVRTAHLGSLHRGARTWTWRGVRDGGARLPDGRYTITISTSTGVGGSLREGYAATTGTVDTVAPRLDRPSGNGVTFYPVRDGYRDVFAPVTSLSSAGALTLVIRTQGNTAVRTITASRGAGRASLSWGGRDAHHHLVPAGTYRWQYTVTDAAGNRSRSAVYRVTVSHKRPVRRVTYMTHRGSSYTSAGGTDVTCASVHKRASSYRHGAAMVNSCPSSSGDFAYADFRFTLPHAVRYLRVAVQVLGRSGHRPSQLSALVKRTDGGLEIPAGVVVRHAGDHWHTLVTRHAGGYVTAYRHMYVTVLLDGAYPGRNDFDLAGARVKITYVGLR